METYTEMTEARMAREEAAHQYQRVLTAAETLRARVRHLEAADTASSAEALKEIVRLASQVDADLTTKSSEFISGGHSVQTLVTRAATQALESLALKAERNSAALTAARLALEPVERELATFA
jgi:hypothetical protein